MGGYTYLEHLHEIEAEIYFLKTEEGGRETAVATGYRGQIYYDGKYFGAEQIFIDADSCHPGETVLARIRFVGTYFQIGQLWLGQQFKLKEGAKTVGKGKITKIIRADFKYWDYGLVFDQLPLECTSYKEEDTHTFQTKMNHFFENNKAVLSVNYSFNELKKDELLIIKCSKKYNSHNHDLLNELIHYWEEEIGSYNAKFKMNYSNYLNQFTYIFSFIIWNEKYLTGKIIIE